MPKTDGSNFVPDNSDWNFGDRDWTLDVFPAKKLNWFQGIVNKITGRKNKDKYILSFPEKIESNPDDWTYTSFDRAPNK